MLSSLFPVKIPLNVSKVAPSLVSDICPVLAQGCSMFLELVAETLARTQSWFAYGKCESALGN